MNSINYLSKYYIRYLTLNICICFKILNIAYIYHAKVNIVSKFLGIE